LPSPDEQLVIIDTTSQNGEYRVNKEERYFFISISNNKLLLNRHSYLNEITGFFIASLMILKIIVKMVPIELLIEHPDKKDYNANGQRKPGPVIFIRVNFLFFSRFLMITGM